MLTCLCPTRVLGRHLVDSVAAAVAVLALEALKLELAPGYHKAWRAMKQDRDSLFSFWISKADTLVPAAGTD